MAELSAEIVAEVVEACKAGAAEAAEAFQRGIDAEVKISVGEPGTIELESLPEGFSGAGLAVVLMVGSAGALVMLPESAGLLPDWCSAPDPTGQSKLTTLAQELGMILLPEQYMPEDFKAARVKNLAGALRRGGVEEGAAVVPLELEQADGKKAVASLIWPAPNPAAVIGAGASKPKPAPKAGPEAKPQPKPVFEPDATAEPETSARPTPPTKQPPATAGSLPPYSRGLLRIKLPVVVTLAEKRQRLGQIMELGPGAIIQFEKSCEEMLELDIGDRAIATGEAVKVGDKFGLRITAVVLPEERFRSIKSRKQAADSTQSTIGGKL